MSHQHWGCRRCLSDMAKIRTKQQQQQKNPQLATRKKPQATPYRQCYRSGIKASFNKARRQYRDPELLQGQTFQALTFTCSPSCLPFPRWDHCQNLYINQILVLATWLDVLAFSVSKLWKKLIALIPTLPVHTLSCCAVSTLSTSGNDKILTSLVQSSLPTFLPYSEHTLCLYTHEQPLLVFLALFL